jgi:hypothetical protein
MDMQKTETLKIIRYLESSDGKYLQHASSAKGEYGIMPKFLSDAKKAFKYKNVKLSEIQKASLGYDFVVKTIGTDSPEHVAYAWLNGVYKYNTKIPYRRPDISKHWYVKRFKASVSSDLKVHRMLASLPAPLVPELRLWTAGK